jgi:hypothetical protein
LWLSCCSIFSFLSLSCCSIFSSFVGFVLLNR